MPRSSNPAPSFAGLAVVALESRMAGPMADLIVKHGGVPVEAPALREIPLGENPEALVFADRLDGGEFDVVIFLTGVGARYLGQAIETRHPRAAWLEALARTKVVVRGPKPLAVLREWRVPVAIQVPEPNTSADILATLDRDLPVAGLRVAVQEYGKPGAELIEGLEGRGAIVTRVPVYRWALPEDVAPLRRAITALADGHVGAVLFTAAQQVVHLFQVAADMGLGAPLREALERVTVVGSIGPTTSEALREHGVRPDLEPEHPKMGHLVATVAAGWRGVAKQSAATHDHGPERGSNPPALPRAAAEAETTPDPLRDSLFLRACRREPVPVTPIWLMRQAGRYMPEYRALRSKVGFLELCKTPALAAEVTVTAAERLGVDAAILFADILLILEPMGFQLEFAKGEGPLIHNPVRRAADVDRVHGFDDPAALGFVLEAVRAIRAALPPSMPLIGFAGAPFTLACYVIEGGASRHYEQAKAFLYRDLGAWDTLMARLVEATAVYLNAQADAGAQALQVFDSWVGTLGPEDYRRFVLPHMRALFDRIDRGVPVIHFATGNPALLELQRDAGGTVVGLDWRVDLGDAWDRLGPEVAVQGNLDPAVLLGPVAEIERQAARVLDRAGGRPGHIFNLGHGVLPQTPIDHVRALIDFVHAAPTIR